MRIALIAVTRRPPAWLQQGAEEYLKRLPPHLRVELVEVPPVRSSGPVDAARRREADRIRAAIPGRRRVVALDERGSPIGTRELAGRLRDWMAQGVDLAFVIGGADGLDQTILAAAHETWSLSGLTLPHGLARLLLIEQLYRAVSILGNHPYHRD